MAEQELEHRFGVLAPLRLKDHVPSPVCVVAQAEPDPRVAERQAGDQLLDLRQRWGGFNPAPLDLLPVEETGQRDRGSAAVPALLRPGDRTADPGAEVDRNCSVLRPAGEIHNLGYSPTDNII